VKDFFKIFFFISGLVIAFAVGKNYGKKSLLESQDLKNISIEKEELAYEKADIANAKAKLQNILDQGATKKTDEILGQILQVFLADLGLQIQNKDLILKQAELCAKEPTAQIKAENQVIEKTSEEVVREIRPQTKENKNQGQFKSNEFLVLNSKGGKDTLRRLDKVIVRDLNSFLSKTSAELESCDQFLGEFKGPIFSETNEKMGSLSFKLKYKSGEESLEFKNLRGEISWFNSPNPPLSQNINESCGRKAHNLAGRIFSLTENRYVQIYKIEGTQQLAGNFYEVMRLGTTKRIGKFVLKRTDRF
jgi:hypothetical protein